jgi:hypothetical protein
LGYGAQAWFESGEKLSRQTLEALSRRVGARVAGDLSGLGRRKPKRIVIEERVERALEGESDPADLVS